MNRAGRSASVRRDRTILIVAMCAVDVGPRSAFIDRKFHTGMIEYARRLNRPLACVVPRMPALRGHRTMDHIEVPLDAMQYRVHTVSVSSATPEDRRTIEHAVDGADIVYVGTSGETNLIAAEQARRKGVPYVVVTEYTLQTDLDIMRASTPSLLRRAVREVRLRLAHHRSCEMIARAAEYHANGYPTYVELAGVNSNRLLFFDTRAVKDDVIPEALLLQRLATAPTRPARLIYSGRYNAMKGALDVVKVGIALHRSGLDFKLDLYGTGPLHDEMNALVRQSGTSHRISIHAPIPYKPDLVDATRAADLFLNCHVQGDPSCTYLETFACGTPIIGYANEMWSALCSESRGGRAVPLGDVQAVAGAALDLLRDTAALREASLQARRFALAHTMEDAWELRCRRILALARDRDGRS